MRLGLALGGGGARGLAHIGVVRALLRAGIPVHVLTGTSMGAIVAVAFALGDPERGGVLRMLEEGTALRTPIRMAYPGERRAGIVERVRNLIAAERILTSNVLGWGTPLLSGVMPLLKEVTRDGRLEDAPVRVGVVATDVESGERVVLTQGNAALAAMASAALPIVFPPVRIGGRLLVDGGFVELVPVVAARELGADLVVAVDVSMEEAGSPVRSGLESLIRAASICSRHHTEAILAQADLVIRPRFSVPIDTLDFDRAREAIEAGLRAGREAVPVLRDLLRRAGARPGEEPPAPNVASP